MSLLKTTMIFLIAILIMEFSSDFAWSQTSSPEDEKSTVVVGSKMFGESYLLSEILAQYLEFHGFPVVRKFGLGGTLLAYEALVNEAIDIYPEYTGTLAEVILKDTSKKTFPQLNEAVKPKGLKLIGPIGFANNYALAVRTEVADKYNLKAISDLVGKDLKTAFNFEFMNREDGWPQLKQVYNLELDPRSLEQTLVFEAFGAGKADVIVIYTTDGKVQKYDMVVLKDDKNYFPVYNAGYLVRRKLNDDVLKLVSDFSNKIDEKRMMQLNAAVDVEGKSYEEVANSFLKEEGYISKDTIVRGRTWRSIAENILQLTWEHLYLVFVSTAAAMLVAVPLGVALFRYKRAAKPVLYIVGLLQTIPSLALLVYMVPWLGVSVEAALMALFLYSLLPILQNTYSGLESVSPQLIQAAHGIGLSKKEMLFSVELPLAAPIILAGVRVAAVINVGTATIAAFIGSGGLGELIVQGLTLNDLMLMQEGAIPAAVLAILVNIGFTAIEKRVAIE